MQLGKRFIQPFTCSRLVATRHTMKFIELKNSTKFASVDDADYDRVKALNTDWYFNITPRGIGYVKSTKGLNSCNKPIFLHKFILNLHQRKGIRVDHKNGDTLNCRQENLRRATHSQNAFNKTRMRSDNTSGYHGIRFNIRVKSFEYRINKAGKEYSIRGFATAESAMLARDLKAKELFGEFATFGLKKV